MADSTNALALPLGVDLWAAYLDGHWPSYAAAMTRPGHPPVVPITVTPHSDWGTVGDGPPDNGTWSEWVVWVERRRAAGDWVTMYTDASTWANGRAAFAAAGVTEPSWWIADWAGPQTPIPATAVAIQYENGPAFDSSHVAGYWPGVDLPTGAPVTGAETKGENMGVTIGTGTVAVSGVTTAGHLVVATCPLATRDTATKWSYMDVTDAGTQAGVDGLTFAP